MGIWARDRAVFIEVSVVVPSIDAAGLRGLRRTYKREQRRDGHHSDSRTGSTRPASRLVVIRRGQRTDLTVDVSGGVGRCIRVEASVVRDGGRIFDGAGPSDSQGGSSTSACDQKEAQEHSRGHRRSCSATSRPSIIVRYSSGHGPGSAEVCHGMAPVPRHLLAGSMRDSTHVPGRHPPISR